MRQALVEQALETQAKLFVQSLSAQHPVLGMHRPAHAFCVPEQLYEHVRVAESQVPTIPFIIGQSALVQQPAMGMQVPLQSLVPLLQVYWQAWVAWSQATVLPAIAAQSALVQQPVTQALPHFLPVVQVKSQVIPLQVAIPPVGVAQGLQAMVPHELVLVLEAQTPLQLCVPDGQAPQAWAMGTHSPLHSFRVPGHMPPHIRPSQVAVPPLISGQGSPHEVPQVIGERSSTQPLLHQWRPVGHAASGTTGASAPPGAWSTPPGAWSAVTPRSAAPPPPSRGPGPTPPSGSVPASAVPPGPSFTVDPARNPEHAASSAHRTTRAPRSTFFSFTSHHPYANAIGQRTEPSASVQDQDTMFNGFRRNTTNNT
jgi:hypothetical protein